MKPNDYKEYVYLRIPKKEYDALITDKSVNITYRQMEFWRTLYKFKNTKRTLAAKLANKDKRKKILKKMFSALDKYYNGLFKEENNLTSYKLAKLANINYLTARKYWEEEGWREEFEEDYLKALRKLQLLF